MPTPWYSLSDALFQQFTAAVAARLTGSPTSYFITADVATDYQEQQEAFSVNLSTASDPLTRTKVSIEQKNLSRASLTVLTKNIVGIVSTNPACTPVLLDQLGLSPRKKPSPIQPADVAPGMHVTSVVARQINLDIHDSSTSPKRKKYPGSIAAWVYFYVGEEYPLDPAEWEFAGAATRGKFEIVVPNSVPNGARVWVTSVWVTQKGQTGPIAPPISTYIQGGLTGIAA